MLLKYVRKLFRGRYKMARYDYQDELYRAQQRELELQRQLGMADAVNRPQINNVNSKAVLKLKTEPHKVFAMIGILFLVLGGILLFLMLGVGSALERKYKKCSQETKAIVIENRVTSSGTYRPVFSFSTSSGTYTVESSIARNPATYSVGQEVTLYYDPDDPNTFYVEKLNTFVKILFGSLGGSFAIFGFIMVLVGIKIKNDRRTSLYQ